MTQLAPHQRVSSAAALAVAAGAAWVLGVTLVATQAHSDPVGAGYDDANRVLTVALALLLAGAVARARGERSRGWRAAVVGTGLMLLGNVLEFVVLPLLGGQPDAMAARNDGATSPLSGIGFGVFVVGALVLLGACIALAVSLRDRPVPTRAVIALTGPAVVASTVLWAVDPAVAAVAASAAAACWWRAVTA